MRTIIIGDVHGCVEELHALVSKVGYQKGVDRLVSLGDLVDKGPSPAQTVALMREIGAEMILGNHEERMLRWLAHEDKRKLTGKVNPMSVSEEQAAEWLSLSAEDVEWLRGAPVTLDLGSNTLAVHGGMLPGIPVDKQKAGTMLRLRYLTAEGKFAAIGADCEMPEGACEWQARYDGEFNLVVGHAVHSLDAPRVDRLPNGRVIHNLDTGCVHGGKLTALILQTGEYVQVQAAREYHPRKGGGE